MKPSHYIIISLALFLAICKGQSSIHVKAVEGKRRGSRGLEWLNPLTWFRSSNEGNGGDVRENHQLNRRRLYLPSVEEPNFLIYNRRGMNPEKPSSTYVGATDLDYSIQQPESFGMASNGGSGTREDLLSEKKKRPLLRNNELEAAAFYESVNPRHQAIQQDCICRCDCCECCPCGEDGLDLISVE